MRRDRFGEDARRQLYWQKPGADLAAFSADNQACARTAGTPLKGEDLVLVSLDLYRACLKHRGWTRETESNFGTPPGFFRGWEDEGPVSPDAVPQQVPTMEPR